LATPAGKFIMKPATQRVTSGYAKTKTTIGRVGKFMIGKLYAIT
jgi:hypothetical protein